MVLEYRYKSKTGNYREGSEMDNIVSLEGTDLNYLISVLTLAKERGQAARILTTEKGIKVSRGQSMWTLPWGQVED